MAKRSYLAGLALSAALALSGCDKKGLEDKVEKPIAKVEEQEGEESKKLKNYKETRINYKTDDFSTNDEILLARMLFGEARNCSDNEKIAVAYTAINRVNDEKKWNGTNLREVILCPWQYSCFNSNANREKLKNPEQYDKKSWEDCLRISEGILSEKYKDPTNGATHYHTPAVAPKWARSKQMKKIGKINNSRHIFYKED